MRVHLFSARSRAVGLVFIVLFSLFLLIGLLVQNTLAQESPIATPTPILVPPEPVPNDFDDKFIEPLLESDPESKGPSIQAPSALLSVAGGTWLSQGPGPSYNGQVEGMTNKEVVGAIHTVAAHPTNSNIMYIGSTNGGIWKTTNAQAASPNWLPLTDNNTSLSIGALEFDPTDVTGNTLVAGNGRYSSFSRNGGSRAGLLRTTDGGATWAEINGGGTLTGLNVSGVAPRGTTIVVTANTSDAYSCITLGAFRSTNGGTTFSQLNYVTNGFPRGFSHDLASNPLDNNILYAGVTLGSICDSGVNGIYKSIDAGENWQKVSNATMDALIVDYTTNNLEIAAYGNNVFANIIQDGQSVGIFHSGDGGTTWTAMDLPLIPKGSGGVITTVAPGTPIQITTALDHGLSSGDKVEITNVGGTTGANGIHTISVLDDTNFQLDDTSDLTPYTSGGNWQLLAGMNPRVKPGSQGGIHAAIVVDPTTSTTVYVGGDRQDNPFPNYIGAMNYTGSLFRGDGTTAATGTSPSPQWDHLTHSDSVATIPNGGTANSSAPHADAREMVFDAAGNLIEVDDGGIYRRTNPQDNTGDWVSINGDLRVTEIHDVAYDNLSNIIISGNQDTGTTYQLTVGGSTWNSLSTGDGGDVAVDNIILAGSNESVRYSSFQRFSFFRRTVWNANGGYVSSTYPALTETPNGTPEIIPQFVTPMVTNNVAGGRLLIGASNGLYESTDEGDTVAQISSGVIANSGGDGGNTMDYGGTRLAVTNPDVLYVANGMEVAVRTTSGGAVTSYPVTGATDIIAGVVMDPEDWMIAYAIDSDQVFKTVDAGVNWTNITGSSFDTNLRSITAAPGELFVGGGNGVYTMDMASPGAWSAYGSGLPNVPVWNLDYDDTDKMLVAGTLGRGAWLMPVTPDTNPLVYAAPTVADCGSFAPCLAVTNPVQNGITAVADTGTVHILGTHTIASPLTIVGSKTVTVQGDTGTLNSSLNFTANGFDVDAGSLTIHGLNLNNATTVFNQTGGSITAFANNITGWTTAYSQSGGSPASLGNNWWDTASAVYNATDPGLSTGDWEKRLGADIASWGMGTNSTSLGDALLTADTGTGTAVIVSFGRGAVNAPFGNGITPYVDTMCSDYYDFFVRGSGTWDVTVPVDNAGTCYANTLTTDRLYYIPDVANCAPSDTQCWARTGLTISHNATALIASGLTAAQLDGTHFVAGDEDGLDPTAIQLREIGIGTGETSLPSTWQILAVILSVIFLGITSKVVLRLRVNTTR